MQLVLDWCLAATQEKDGTSLLNIGAPEPALCQDPEFLKWCKLRLITTLGPETCQAEGRAQGGGVGDQQLVECITSNMGQSFLASVQALAPSIAGAARQGGNTRDGGSNDMGGKLYSKNNVAALKGYCGVVNPAGIPTIWDSFQQTQEIVSHRHNLRVTMFKWAKDTSKDINKAPFFTEQTVKDIMGLQFNPGEAVPTYSSAQRGISILTCRPKSAHKVETIKDYKEAHRATAHTAQFNEVRRHKKTPPSPPPDNDFELRLSINTFCALIWTLFGDECDYYKGLLEVCKTLDQQEVHIIKDSFTANVCPRITWAILSNRHSFFNTVLVELQIQRGECFKWPTSLIHKITDDVRFAKPIKRLHYPTKWLLLSSSGQSTAGNAGGGGGYGGGNNQSNNQGNARESNRSQQNQGGWNNGGGGGARRQQQPWVDD
jgi:hypothetical protein